MISHFISSFKGKLSFFSLSGKKRQEILFDASRETIKK